MSPQRTPPRRLPAPKIPAGLRPLPPPPPGDHPSEDNPYVAKITSLLEQMAAVSGLSPYVLLKDWLGMLESGLKMWPANMRAVALEGRLIEDPPEIQAIFRQARERYLRLSETRPAVYRRMQEAFSQAFALLLESARPGLDQVPGNPDVLGQVFLACLRPGPASPWRRYFPAWPSALAAARAAIPDGELWVHLSLADAALHAREEGHPIDLVPGANFPAWLEVILPYVEPVDIGPPLISSSVELLAAAAQFPAWALQTGLITFRWDEAIEPLIQQLINIDVMLYDLNGYLLAHYEALTEIETHLLQSPEPRSPASPPQAPPDPAEPPASEAGPALPPGQSFADLFRKKSTS